MEVYEIKVSKTGAQIEADFANGGLGLEISDVNVGDRFCITTLGDNGEIGGGAVYIAEAEDIEDGLVWVTGR